MSVLMTLQAKGDPAKLEKLAANEPDRIRAISDDAKRYGLIGHRFYGSDDGQILVLDEWPDAESFQHFFGHMAHQIEPLMAAAGVNEEPHPVFWRELDTRDRYGWNA